MTESAGATAVDPTGGRNPKTSGLRVPYLQIAIRPPRSGVADITTEPGRSGEIMPKGPQLFASYSDPERHHGLLEEGWLPSGTLGHVDEDCWSFVTGLAQDVNLRGGHIKNT